MIDDETSPLVELADLQALAERVDTVIQSMRERTEAIIKEEAPLPGEESETSKPTDPAPDAGSVSD